MNYKDWYAQQTPKRRQLSERLMNASHNLGKANREGDKEIAARYQTEIQEIYKEIGEADG